MSYSSAVDISLRFTVPVERVWQAIVDADEFASWWPYGGHIDAHKGGSIHLSTPRPKKKRDRTLTGKVLKCDEHERLVIAAHAEPRDVDTRVTLLFSQLKHKSRLRLVEEATDDALSAVMVTEIRDGWREVLAALDTHLAK
ncbi:SRPBCC family protein [Gulosibacter faecalis]|uniref:SRPBCC domain-containing protein n=1 Tax=Gulosibacter faecalis TaxID=272240 RepID=A0ABW5UY54_9MICO|nr:SRPBCC domain-containing protein [Gulosibacter faecalis]